MEVTRCTDSETVRRTEIDSSLEIRFQNFGTSSKRVSELIYMKHKDSSYELKVDVSVFAFPNGTDENTVGWITIMPDVDLTCIHRPMNSSLSWIVSVIDTEGNSRFPQSFERDGGREGTLKLRPDADFSHGKYLERSFILSRADEFLVDDVLTLRCDIFMSWSGISHSLPSARRFYDRDRSPFKKFFGLLPQRVCFEKDGDPNDTFTLFDLASPNLTLPQFQDFIERFGLYGGSFNFSPPESKEDISDILEHVWIFDSPPDKFILSLDLRKDTVGTRFLKASSLVRRCVEMPMREQRDKSIVFSDTEGQTLRIVLYFLAVGMLREFDFNQLVKVYTFSHLYEMEDLQRRCAEYMTEDFDFVSDFENELRDFEELERLADLYSDQYLSELLESRLRQYEQLERDLPRLSIDDKPCSDCYI